MSESPNKHIKILNNFPEDLVVRISSFLPIQPLLANCLISRLFRQPEIRSLDLDFSGISSAKLNQSEAVNIIQNVFNKHEGPEINRFVLCLKDIGADKETIASWINTCIGKNVQELVLDFSRSKNVMQIPVDFSAIKTLTLLDLRWCNFEIPDNSPKGLKLLRSLTLMRTEVTKEMIDAVFTNCIHLESLELIKCTMYGLLNISAYNHMKFKSLVVSSMPNVTDIVSYAPKLEYFKYDGYVINVFFFRTDAPKEANLHYKRTRRIYDSSDMVVYNMKSFIEVSVFATTNIFLEALTDRYTGEGRMQKNCPFTLENLTEFKIFFKAPTFCTLFDIAEFLKYCPKLEHVVIDINNFTFERTMFWEIHQKHQIENNSYIFKFLKKVKIIGYKGHWHELDIVQFFVKNAPSLEKLELKGPSNPKIKLYEADCGRISYIKSISPRKDLIKFTEG